MIVTGDFMKSNLADYCTSNMVLFFIESAIPFAEGRCECKEAI